MKHPLPANATGDKAALVRAFTAAFIELFAPFVTVCAVYDRAQTVVTGANALEGSSGGRQKRRVAALVSRKWPRNCMRMATVAVHPV